jgi:hypothetical protein
VVEKRREEVDEEEDRNTVAEQYLLAMHRPLEVSSIWIWADIIVSRSRHASAV